MQCSFEMECIFQRYESGIRISSGNNGVPSTKHHFHTSKLQLDRTQDSTAEHQDISDESTISNRHPSPCIWLRKDLCNTILIRSTCSVRIGATINMVEIKTWLFQHSSHFLSCLVFIASHMASTLTEINDCNDWTLTKYKLCHVNMM